MAQKIAWWAMSYGAIAALVYEWPQIYPGSKQKTDPNDLPGLAAVGGGVAGILASTVTSVRTPTPREWAGQTPKSKTGDPWLSPRGERIRSRLSPAEFALTPAQHDVLDAVAIGLWAVGRFEQRRVFPGAV